MKDTVIINEKDNVIISLAGTDQVPPAHKIARRPIKKGEYIIKYGEIIGRATEEDRKSVV